MQDFVCVDLAKHTRGGGAAAPALSGELKKHLAKYKAGPAQILGMPFEVASGPDGAGIVLPPGEGLPDHHPRERLRSVDPDRPRRRRRDASKDAARYILHREGAADIARTVRLGLELPMHSLWGMNLGTFDTTMPGKAEKGDSWSEVQMGLKMFPPAPSPYRIFVWENPEPAVPITSLECVNLGEAPIVLCAVTLCNEAEHPVRVIPRTALAIDLSRLGETKLEDVVVEIDRGMVVRVDPLAAARRGFRHISPQGMGHRSGEGEVHARRGGVRPGRREGEHQGALGRAGHDRLRRGARARRARACRWEDTRRGASPAQDMGPREGGR